MTIQDRPIMIGLGCASAAGAGEIISLVEACLVEGQCDAEQIIAFATHCRKQGSTALMDTAAHFGVPLYFLADHELASGIAGTCEAVAATAGPLHLSKRKSRYATCAIALYAPDPLAQSSASAAMAASIVPTSVAGP